MRSQVRALLSPPYVRIANNKKNPLHCSGFFCLKRSRKVSQMRCFLGKGKTGGRVVNSLRPETHMFMWPKVQFSRLPKRRRPVPKNRPETKRVQIETRFAPFLYTQNPADNPRDRRRRQYYSVYVKSKREKSSTVLLSQNDHRVLQFGVGSVIMVKM